MDTETGIELAKALGAESLATTIYNDVVSPAAKVIGKNLELLAKTVEIALSPLAATVWGFERTREWLLANVTTILSKRNAKVIIAPPISLAGPLLTQIQFASEEPDLREMYAKLLATSMEEAVSDRVHPSFVNIIQQLTADEAKILKYIASLEAKYRYWQIEHDNFRYIKNDYLDFEKTILKICSDSGVINMAKASVYIENLMRLKILTHKFSDFFSDLIPENELHTRYWGHGSARVDTDYSEYIELSSYGKDFLEACVID